MNLYFCSFCCPCGAWFLWYDWLFLSEEEERGKVEQCLRGVARKKVRVKEEGGTWYREGWEGIGRGSGRKMKGRAILQGTEWKGWAEKCSWAPSSRPHPHVTGTLPIPPAHRATETLLLYYFFFSFFSFVWNSFHLCFFFRQSSWNFVLISFQIHSFTSSESLFFPVLYTFSPLPFHFVFFIPLSHFLYFSSISFLFAVAVSLFKPRILRGAGSCSMLRLSGIDPLGHGSRT